MGMLSVGPSLVRNLIFTLNELEATEIFAYFNIIWKDRKQVVLIGCKNRTPR